jgi:hypothetical protein
LGRHEQETKKMVGSRRHLFGGTRIGFLLKGQAFYQSYWVGASFTPILVIVGLLAIAMALKQLLSRMRR